jgi:hypothetical protein
MSFPTHTLFKKDPLIQIGTSLYQIQMFSNSGQFVFNDVILSTLVYLSILNSFFFSFLQSQTVVLWEHDNKL